MILEEIVATSASLFEAIGVLTMLLGAVVALIMTAKGRGESASPVFQSFRNRLGRGIVLGLEFLVAADILRTISTEPTMNEVAVLAAIVAIRTFLSFSLAVELEGRWPWQRAGTPAR
jgi:uncharacterized membrane protein